MKGKVSIILPKRIYSYGEKIDGYIHMHAKKHVSIHDIELHLIAYKLERAKSKKGVHYRLVEVFRKTEYILKAENILPGIKRDIDFSITIPEITNFDIDMQRLIDDKLMRNTTFSSRKPRRNAVKLKWKMMVEAHCEGLDLSSHRKIRIEQ